MNQILMMGSGSNVTKECPCYRHIKAKGKSTADVGDNTYYCQKKNFKLEKK